MLAHRNLGRHVCLTALPSPTKHSTIRAQQRRKPKAFQVLIEEGPDVQECRSYLASHAEIVHHAQR